jgi:hypothetical protein
MRPGKGDIFVLEPDPATAGSVTAGDQVEQSCLSCPIGPHKADDLTFFKLEVDLFEGPMFSKPLTQCFQS